ILTRAAVDAARLSFECPARVREYDSPQHRLSIGRALRVFARRCRIKNLCSSVAIRLADESVEFRCRAPAVDAFAGNSGCFTKIGCEARHMKRGGGIYDDQVAGGAEVLRVVGLQ